jgi:hypothetical protein
MHRRVLAILLKALGEAHPLTAASYNSLAVTDPEVFCRSGLRPTTGPGQSDPDCVFRSPRAGHTADPITRPPVIHSRHPVSHTKMTTCGWCSCIRAP